MPFAAAPSYPRAPAGMPRTSTPTRQTVGANGGGNNANQGAPPPPPPTPQGWPMPGGGYSTNGPTAPQSGGTVISNIPGNYTPPATPGYSQNMPGTANTNGSVNPNQNQPTGDWAGTQQANQLAAQYAAQYGNQAGILQQQYNNGVWYTTAGAAQNNQALQQQTGNALALNQLGSNQNAIDQAQNQFQQGQIQKQGDLSYQQYLTDFNNSQSQYNNDISLNQTQQQLASQNYTADKGLLGTKVQLSNGQWTNDVDYINKTWGIGNQAYANDQANFGNNANYLNSQYGFAQTRANQADQGTALREGVNNRAALTDATNRGAMLSQGTGDNFKDIKSQADLSRSQTAEQRTESFAQTGNSLSNLYHDQASNTLNHQQDQAGLQHQYTSDSLAHQGDLANLANQGVHLDTGYKGTTAALTHDANALGLNLTHSQASLTNQMYQNNNAMQTALGNAQYAQQGLTNLAQSYGIKAQDLQQALANGVTKNNLNMNEVIAKYDTAMKSGNAQLIGQFNQFMASILQAAPNATIPSISG